MYEKKALEIIGILCRESYRQANTKPDGTLYKKHRPYAVPELARALMDALALEDEKEREHEVKRLFQVYYTGALSLI